MADASPFPVDALAFGGCRHNQVLRMGSPVWYAKRFEPEAGGKLCQPGDFVEAKFEETAYTAWYFTSRGLSLWCAVAEGLTQDEVMRMLNWR